MKIQVNTCIRYVGIAKNNKIEQKFIFEISRNKINF